MAGSDSEVRISTRLGNSQLSPGLKDANGKLKALGESFSEVAKGITDMDKELARVREQYDKQLTALQSISGRKNAAKMELAETKLADTNAHLIETERRAVSAEAQAFGHNPIVQSIRNIAAETDKVNAAIERQRREFEAASALYDRAEQALSIAKASGDALAESLAQFNLDKAISDVERADANVKALIYEAQKLGELFEQIAISPEGVQALAKMKAEASALTFTLEDAAGNAKTLSDAINETIDFDVQPIEDNTKKLIRC